MDINSYLIGIATISDSPKSSTLRTSYPFHQLDLSNAHKNTQSFLVALSTHVD